jgi:hypothetical protein
MTNSVMRTSVKHLLIIEFCPTDGKATPVTVQTDLEALDTTPEYSFLAITN